MACFFGFGSLVNTATHKYETLTPARVDGWARAWVHNELYEHALLSVIPEPDTQIHGLMAKVPSDDWAELDLRETGYTRHALPAGVWNADTTAVPITQTDVQMYISNDNAPPSAATPILWSYLETVLFGYYQVFGSVGVETFMATTRQWTDVLDDRKNPLYPRYKPVTEGAAAAVVIPVIAGLNVVTQW